MTDPALLRATLDKFPSLTVHVLGDAIVDLYTACSPLGMMSKTAALSVQRHGQTSYVGGAGIVAKHMAAAGARVTLTTLLGRDPAGDLVRADLKTAGVALQSVSRTPTPTKERFMTENESRALLQVETWDDAPLDDCCAHTLTDFVARTPTDVFVVSDFRHGIFTKATIPDLLEAIPPGALRAADSQLSSRWPLLLDFPGFDLLTPNEREARFAVGGDQDGDVHALAMRLAERAACLNLILTRGKAGALSIRKSGAWDFFDHVPAYATHVVDPVGAGDALLAYAALALRVSDDLRVAATLGSLAAAVACERAGNVPVTPGDVVRKIWAL